VQRLLVERLRLVQRVPVQQILFPPHTPHTPHTSVDVEGTRTEVGVGPQRGGCATLRSPPWALFARPRLARQGGGDGGEKLRCGSSGRVTYWT
jgi:hypothetical protein